MHNSVLVVEKSELKENLYNKDIDLTNLKCKLSTSKTKGEMSEQNLREILDSSGYRCEKRGNHAGDLWIYSREDKLVCILEIKNYGSENKSKLGINGSETKKMYNDIETQLTIDNRINVPWLFISMGCEIPNSESLRKTHLGVKCYYLSMPTSKELIIWIDFCETINELNNSKNDVNLIYIQQKITEIEEIFSNLLEKRPNFKTLKDNVNKLSSSLDKEEKRFNKILEDSVKRMNQINKSIMLDDNSYNNDVNLMLNIDELSHNEIKVHVKQIQSYTLNLLEEKNILESAAMVIINEEKEDNNEIKELYVKETKEKCDICGALVRNLRKHKKTNKCKSFSMIMKLAPYLSRIYVVIISYK